MKTSTGGFLKSAKSVTNSRKSVYAMAAITMLALTSHGADAASCHDKYKLLRQPLYRDINSLGATLNATGLVTPGSTLSPEQCELIRSVETIQKQILSSWLAEQQCSTKETNPWPYVQDRINEREGLKGLTEGKLQSCPYSVPEQAQQPHRTVHSSHGKPRLGSSDRPSHV